MIYSRSDLLKGIRVIDNCIQKEIRLPPSRERELNLYSFIVTKNNIQRQLIGLIG